MLEPDDSIFPLLRERRAELQRNVPDFDRCFALNEAWLRKLRQQPEFQRRVVKGETILADYVERQDEPRPEPAD